MAVYLSLSRNFPIQLIYTYGVFLDAFDCFIICLHLCDTKKSIFITEVSYDIPQFLSLFQSLLK